METTTADTLREPWNKGKLVSQKTPFKLKEIWAIRIRLQVAAVRQLWHAYAPAEPKRR